MQDREPSPIVLQLAQEGHQTRLLLRVELEFENKVKELDRVFQGEQTAVVKVRWRLLDAAQWERLDWSLRGRHQAVDRLRFVETLDLQIVHQIVRVKWGRVARGTLRLAEKEILALHLRRIRREFVRVEFPIPAQAGRRREVEQLLDLRHKMDLAAAL